MAPQRRAKKLFDTKPIVINAKDHLLGRLASVVAKTLLNGKRVVVLRCEHLNISGGHLRSKAKYLGALRKRCNINPARGPFHFRAPREIFARTVRGMLPHKTARGRHAYARLRTYEGIPPQFVHRKSVCVPQAMRCLSLKPSRKFAVLERLSHEIGWKYRDVVRTLDAKRRLSEYIRLRKTKQFRKIGQEAAAIAAKQAPEAVAVLNSYGFK